MYPEFTEHPVEVEPLVGAAGHVELYVDAAPRVPLLEGVADVHGPHLRRRLDGHAPVAAAGLGVGLRGARQQVDGRGLPARVHGEGRDHWVSARERQQRTCTNTARHSRENAANDSGGLASGVKKKQRERSTLIPFRTGNVQPDSVAEEDVVAVREGPVVDHQVVRHHELPRLHQLEIGVELCGAVPSSTSVIELVA